MAPHSSRTLGTASLTGWRVVVCLALAMTSTALTPLHGQLPDSASTVQGEVREHETGVPLTGVAVSLASGPRGTRGIGTRVTDAEGKFLFRRVPPGTYRLVATLIGYQEVRDTLEVRATADLDLGLSLSVFPIPLEPLVVEVRRRDREAMSDFENRRRTFSGYFFDQEEIEDRKLMFFTDLLRTVPGARVVPVDSYDHTVLLRGGCRPALWVDGMQLMGVGGMDAVLPAMDLEAVEVYNGASLPVEFGANPCGAIVVWTRRGEPSVGTGSLWRRLLFAAGVITLALLATR